VFRALASIFQLSLPFGDDLLSRLRAAGLRRTKTLVLTRNRTVMVSFRGDVLRLHRSFAEAPPEVLKAVATFVEGRTRRQRMSARATLLGYAVPRAEAGMAARKRRREARLPEDAPTEERLVRHHATLNAERFDGALKAVSVRVSRRLRSKLGYYRLATPDGTGAEIVISRRHLRRHGWEEAVATLLHEMVHQWQDESGLPVDHGPAFRAKARAVGVTPAARRAVG
jgi:hypothetical protein